jgi:Nif-specific regulatory protein
MGNPAPSGEHPSVLLAIGQLLQTEVDVDTLLRRILDLIAEAMDADRATLYLIDRDRSELYSRAAHLPELDEIRLVVGQGIAGHVAATGEPVSTVDVHNDNRFFHNVDATTGYTTRSVLAVPVFGHPVNVAEDSHRADEPMRRRRVVAVLQVLNKRGAESFDDDDRELLEALANQVSEALAMLHLDDSRDRPSRYNKIVGASDSMRAVFDIISNAATTDATVLVLGESGTGKELVARAIHANSARAEGPFVKVDCTAIPAGLIEAELFGHEKGAFTGAEKQVLGKCELASGGTLFLDEIGELPLPLQAKLLRFVQDRELERVGGREVIKANVRVVAATNRDLAAWVRNGRFRKDLFYRIKVVEIIMPTLRERGPVDIELLARHFLRIYARKHDKRARELAPATRAALRNYQWPGNIRELEHCIESAVVFCPDEVVQPAHLSLPHDASAVAEWDDPIVQDSVPSGLTLEDVEKRYILRTLAECGGNRTKAAATLGIGRNTLVRKLKRYGVV